MSTTPFWKKIHQTVSGYSRNVTEDIVEEILKLSKKELMEGLVAYKPYTKQGYTDWSTSTDAGNNMKEFVHDLSQDLDLDTSITYPVMCNYLMFEYYGKIKEFWQITRIGTTINLKESIWNFYTAERMFLLKTWRHILEHVDRTNYEFAQQYKDFLKNIKIEELQDSILKQIEQLGNEINFKNFDEKNHHLENWLCRNTREQIELTLILALTLKHRTLSVTQLIQAMKIFISNNFGTAPPLFETRKYLKKLDLEELMYAEMGCYFVVLERYWDTDISNFWQNDSLKIAEQSLLSLHLNPGHTIIMLSWLILKFKNLQFEADSTKITELFERKPFVLLHALITSEMFKNCTVGDVVIDAAHKMLDELCLLYDDRTVFYEQTGIISVLSEFLKKPHLADLCLETRNGLDSLIEISIETFPYDYLAFTIIMEPLLGQPKHYKNTIHLLNNVPSFLSDMTWSVPRDDIYVIDRSQSAFADSDLIVFPPGTSVRSFPIFGKNLVQYKGNYNYFIFLEHLVNLLVNTGLAKRKFEEGFIQKVTNGYRVVIQGIKCCVDMDLKVIGIERIMNKLHNLLNYMDGPLLDLELIKTYFEVQNAMLEYRNASLFEILPETALKVFFPKFKQEYVGRDIKELLFNHYIYEETMFTNLFKEEEFKDDHSLMVTYVRILHNVIRIKFQYKNFQLSGISYLLNFVFLQHQTWAYKDENQKTQITLGCLKIFHFILQKDPNELNDDEKKIYYLCHYGFLSNAYIVEAFFRLFIKEKYHLIFLMERESNWIQGPALDRLKCIQMQLALLLLMMNKKKTFTKCNFNDRLPFIVKPVASYFTNSYSHVIAELSCRFLEKLAQDPYIPLLALLELDHYQVQSLFLERLRDPLEEENVKLAIIDLINTCISSQNGMTAAFFNLKCFMYWDGTESDVFSGDSVSDFMVDYLQNIKKSHEYFKNPLQLGILRLLYNLWVNHRENLIDNIANLKDFWPVMFDPLLCDYVQDTEIYTVILRIVNLEISANVEKVDEKLIDTIDKFLKDEVKCKMWMEFILKCSETNSKNNLDLLNAWLEFTVLTKKVTPGSFSENMKTTLIHSCLDALNTPGESFHDVENIYLWSRLYLIVITTWQINQSQQKTVMHKILMFMRSLSIYYKFLTPRIREIILCGISNTITNLKKHLNENSPDMVTLFYFLGQVIDVEHECLPDVWKTEDDSERIKKLKPWLVIILIANDVLTVEHSREVALWFSYRKLLQRIMDSVIPMLINHATLPFAKMATDFLVTYAESPYYRDFSTVDLYTFHFKIQPPPLHINFTDAVLSGLPVSVKEWWITFITLIKLNRLLLTKLGRPMLDTCFIFVKEHDQLIKELISLTKYTVDMTALTVVSESLRLIHIMFSYLPHWCVRDPASYQAIMEGVKTTMNACVVSILGYKKICFYNMSPGTHVVHLGVMQNPPVELLVSVLNKLTEIIYLGCTCMKKTKPDLVAQLNAQHILEHVTLMVDNDFSVPRFEYPIPTNLTYGTLLCLADYLCRTLNQLSPSTPSSTQRCRKISMTALPDEIKVKNLGKIFEHCTATYEKCMGFVVFAQKTDDLPNDKLTSLLHYDMSEFSASSTSAILQLDYHMVRNSLEALMSFLTGEIFYTIRNMDEETLFQYKRELSSEIQFFYEFVRKRTGELYNAMALTPTPRTPSALPPNEHDIVKRYMLTKIQDGNMYDIAENNYVLVIAQWLIKYCHISN